jgi:sirohydrochlorin cobaltochelatase
MKPARTGILLAAFGSASRVGENALALFDRQTRLAFPGIPVRWAFTSPHMRSRLAEARKKTDSVHKALMRMAFERYTHVAVQSLHLIPGKEYEALQAETRSVAEAGGPLRVALGKPLLDTPHDVAEAAKALLAHLPDERTADEAVVCVGHGTWHAGAASYQSLSDSLRRVDPRIFIGTLAGEHSIETLLPELKTSGTRTVWLLPLLSVIGKHAEQDMAGRGGRSWRGRLEAEGFACNVVLRGTAEYAGFADIWLEHLGRALASLGDAGSG